MLCLAWAVLGVSLFLPAYSKPWAFSGGNYTNTIDFVVLSFVGAFGGQFGSYTAFALGPVCFLVTPFAVGVTPASFVFRIYRTLSLCGLASTWIPGIIRWLQLSGRDDGRFMWGYYLFAGAHTLALLACLLAPVSERTSKADNKRGLYPAHPKG